MASKRYLYSDTIDSFLQKNTDTIVGEITLSATQDINKETSNSWQQEVEVLKNVLSPYAQKVCTLNTTYLVWAEGLM